MSIFWILQPEGGLKTFGQGEAPDGAEIVAEVDWRAALAAAMQPAPVDIDLLAYAADKRWQAEIGGIVVSGVPVATDDRSKILITGARVAAMLDAAWSTIWHGADGQTYPVDAAAMVAISDAVQAHVNAGFDIFATVKAAIEAGSITSTSEIDAAFAA
jgi:hypothetical protein